MEPLTVLTSIVAPLLRDDIDTDAMIPAEYMRSLATDPATGLFARWRYRADGSPDPEFVLNDPRYRGARILLAGRNFGCGSSRENAVWALHGFGIRCVIALGFSDIFRENALRNGLLPLALAGTEHDRLSNVVLEGELSVTIDVASRQLELPSGETIAFDIETRRQVRLMSGCDEVEETLRLGPQIEQFRRQQRQRAPWLHLPSAEDS